MEVQGSTPAREDGGDSLVPLSHGSATCVERCSASRGTILLEEPPDGVTGPLMALSQRPVSDMHLALLTGVREASGVLQALQCAGASLLLSRLLSPALGWPHSQPATPPVAR